MSPSYNIHTDFAPSTAAPPAAKYSDVEGNGQDYTINVMPTWTKMNKLILLNVNFSNLKIMYRVRNACSNLQVTYIGFTFCVLVI